MKITIFGLAITSSWGNGHATTFRALCEALHARGHQITFFEKNVEWYASNRDMPEPPFCKVIHFEDWEEVKANAKHEIDHCDVALIGSFFPHGVEATDLVLDSHAPVKVFYDIDTPITLAQLRENSETDYLETAQIPGFDIYFSFSGGAALEELESRFGAKRAVPLYCSVDEAKYKRLPAHPRFACDMSYMGTYAADRQPKIEAMLCRPATLLPHRNFIVAGPMYPKSISWPKNVERIMHLEPKYHPMLYSSSRLVLNVTRRDMVLAGYSPSVRLFEAAACGAAIVSDNWPGLDTLLTPGREVLLPSSIDDLARYFDDYDEAELRRIGKAAQARILSQHTSAHRAEEFEQHVASVLARSANAAA
jgi:spore maturation protein CgeB